MPVEFRFARRDEYPRISQFLHDHWAADHVYCRDRALFDWTFRRPGHWPDEGYSVALAEEGGELAGILGGIPFAFNRFGARSKGIWMANYVVRPDHRRGPTALQLLAMFRPPRYEACVAFGINPATSVIYRVLRGEVLPAIPRHFAVLPGCEDRVCRLLAIAHPEWEAERMRSLATAFTLSGLPDAGDCCAALPPSWDREDWPAIAAGTVGAARDRDYLEWRYLRHPRFDYRIIAVPEGGRTGLAIWRLETIRRDTEEGRCDVDRIGRLLEFIPASRGNARALFAALLRQLREAGAFGADFYCFHGPTRELLAELGFRHVAIHPGGSDVPTRFQPLDGKGGGILSALFLAGGPSSCSDGAASAWYWTKSDSDQDRPN
jgi:hypothetical protein